MGAKKPSRKSGRQTLLTPELSKRVCGYISDGLCFDDACRLAGIATSTFRAWRQKGEEDEGREVESDHLTFLHAVRVAEIGFKRFHLLRIAKASKQKTPGVWQASGWLLERKFPSEFSLRQQIAVTDKLEAFVKAFEAVQ